MFSRVANCLLKYFSFGLSNKEFAQPQPCPMTQKPLVVLLLVSISFAAPLVQGRILGQAAAVSIAAEKEALSPSYTLANSAIEIEFQSQGGTVTKVIDKSTGVNVVANGTSVQEYNAIVNGLFGTWNGHQSYSRPTNVTLTEPSPGGAQTMRATWARPNVGEIIVEINVTSILVGPQGLPMLHFQVVSVSGSPASAASYLHSLFFVSVPVMLSECASVVAGAYNNLNSSNSSSTPGSDFAIVVQPTDYNVGIGGYYAPSWDYGCPCGVDANPDGIVL